MSFRGGLNLNLGGTVSTSVRRLYGLLLVFIFLSHGARAQGQTQCLEQIRFYTDAETVIFGNTPSSSIWLTSAISTSVVRHVLTDGMGIPTTVIDYQIHSQPVQALLNGTVQIVAETWDDSITPATVQALVQNGTLGSSSIGYSGTYGIFGYLLGNRTSLVPFSSLRGWPDTVCQWEVFYTYNASFNVAGLFSNPFSFSPTSNATYYAVEIDSYVNGFDQFLFDYYNLAITKITVAPDITLARYAYLFSTGTMFWGYEPLLSGASEVIFESSVFNSSSQRVHFPTSCVDDATYPQTSDNACDYTTDTLLTLWNAQTTYVPAQRVAQNVFISSTQIVAMSAEVIAIMSQQANYAQMSSAEINAIIEEVTCQWLNNNTLLWQSWVPEVDTQTQSNILMAILIPVIVSIVGFCCCAITAWVCIRRGYMKRNLLAPRQDYVAVAFTDIQNSTALWALSPKVMRRALEIHHRIMRAAIQRHQACVFFFFIYQTLVSSVFSSVLGISRSRRRYEVKTIGDAFMVTFSTASAAVNWATAVQRDLNNADWPSGLSKTSDCEKVLASGDVANDRSDSEPCSSDDDGTRAKGFIAAVRAKWGSRDRPNKNEPKRIHLIPYYMGKLRNRKEPDNQPEDDDPVNLEDRSAEQGKYIYRGLRVRIGINWGHVDIQKDVTSKAFDYYGSVVNVAARTEAAAHGGQIIVTKKVVDAVKNQSNGTHQAVNDGGDDDDTCEADGTDHRRQKMPWTVARKMLRGNNTTVPPLLHGAKFEPLGEFIVKGYDQPVRFYNVSVHGLRSRKFPPPRAQSTRQGSRLMPERSNPGRNFHSITAPLDPTEPWAPFVLQTVFPGYSISYGNSEGTFVMPSTSSAQGPTMRNSNGRPSRPRLRRSPKLEDQNEEAPS